MKHVFLRVAKKIGNDIIPNMGFPIPKIGNPWIRAISPQRDKIDERMLACLVPHSVAEGFGSMSLIYWVQKRNNFIKKKDHFEMDMENIKGNWARNLKLEAVH